MYLKKIAAFLCLTLFVLCCQNNSNKINIDGLTAELQAKLDELTEHKDIPGATLAVVLPDERTISIASGTADIGKKRKMVPGDRMFSGSIGKTYLVPIILQLEKENKLKIHDPVKKYFKGEEWYSQLPNRKDLTLRMLLNHTGGIPEYVGKAALWEDIKKFPDKTWEPIERLKHILGDKPVNAAGKGWNYADTNYIILGMIIEKITGNTYYDELDKRVLKPLKLHNTTPSDKRELKGLIPGYSRLGAPFYISGKVLTEDGKYIFNPQLEWTGGGLVTNSLELALWAKWLYEGKILPGKALEKMLTGVKAGEGFDYGLGVFIWNSDFGISYGHSGFVPGYNSVMEYVSGHKFSAALQFNCDNVSEVLKKSSHDNTAEFIKIVIKFL
ncbi:MAG: beta-lactamase family protein [Candidatus Aminicenantes bacterium]|nr:beta-lactamase family protein [Candidatus Aminicenantes bacterium]